MTSQFALMQLEEGYPIYRIGEVSGPFAPLKKYWDGTPISVNKQRKDGLQWIVRIAFGKCSSMMEDVKFHDANSAQRYWDSLPTYPKD